MTYDYEIAATDLLGDPVNFSANGLPTWLTLVDNGDGTASLSGTPSSADIGSYPLSITANDGSNDAQQDFILTVTDGSAPGTPTGLLASSVSFDGVDLSWHASTDNVAVTSYQVLQDGVVVGNSETNAITVSGLLPATNYSFTVRRWMRRQCI